MASAGHTLLAAKRVVEKAEERFVPRRLSSNFTSASADSERRLAAVLREHDIDPAVHEPIAASRLQRDRVESLRELPTSLMPERLLDPLTPQERRDLFRYLQQAKP